MKKILFILIYSFFLNIIVHNIGFAQIAGYVTACPNSVGPYGLGHIAQYDQYPSVSITPENTHSTIIVSPYLEYTWTWLDPIKTNNATMIIGLNGGGSATFIAVFPIITNVEVTNLVNGSIPPTTANVECTVTALATFEGQDRFSGYNVFYKWSLQDVAGHILVSFPERVSSFGTTNSLKFVPNTYRAALSPYFSRENIFLVVTAYHCTESPKSNSYPLRIDYEKPTNISYVRTPENCLGADDGKITIDSLYWEGQTYNSSKPLPVDMKFSVFNEQKSIISKTFPVTISGIGEEQNQIIVDIMYGSQAVLSSDPVTVPAMEGPTLTLTVFGSSPDCYSSNLTGVTASVSPENFYNFFGASGNGYRHFYNYNLSTPDTFNLYAISNANPVCRTNTVQFINPHPISIININDASNDFSDALNPTMCQPANGEIAIKAINGQIGGTATFELFKMIDGTPQSAEISDAFGTGDNCQNNFKNLSDGTYYVVVNDGCPLQSSTSQNIILDPLSNPINIDLVTESAKCNGGQGNIILNGFSYLTNLYPGASTIGINNYHLQLQQIGGTAIFPLPNLSMLPYGLNGDFPALSGGSDWNLSVVYNPTGCASVPVTLHIDHPDALVVDQDNTYAVCDQDYSILKADVSGGTEPYKYRWREYGNTVNLPAPDTTSSLKVWEGRYELELVDAHNCRLGQTVNDDTFFPEMFTAPRPQTLDIFVDKVVDVDLLGKSNGSVTFGTSYHASNVEYSNDGINFQHLPQFNGLAMGLHTFYIRNEYLCLDSIEVNISVAPIFSTSLKSVNHIKCHNGKDGQIAITANGGVKPYRFRITGPSGTIEQEDSVFNGLVAGTYSIHAYYNTYEYSIPDITLIEPTLALQATITDHADAVCGKSVGMATVTTTGGTQPYSYLWNDPDAQTTSKADSLKGAIYTVTVHDANNCMAGASIQLFDPKGPVLKQIGADSALCSNSLGGGGAMLSVSGGIGPFDVYWKVLDLHDSIANNIAPGNYTATVTDSTNCTSSLSGIYVPSPDELMISFDDFEDPTCFNGTNGEITASGVGGTPNYQFNWQNIANTGNTNLVSGLTSGNYTLKLTDAHNCEATKSFELRNPDPISINLPDSVFICEGQTATFDVGSPGMDHHWVLSDGNTADQQIIYAQTQGNYSVTVTSALGCSNNKTIYLKHENRVLDAAFIISSQATMSDTIIAIEISWPMPDSLQWFIPENFEVIKDLDYYKELIPLQAGEYIIGMKAYMSGCSDFVEKKITIFPSENSNKNGIEKPEDLIKSAKLFPNPTSGNFQIEIELSRIADIQADVFSMRGLKIIPTKSAYGDKQYLIDFNLLRLEPGVYFVNIVAEKEVKKLKFIVE